MAWGWINNDNIFILGWTIPLTAFIKGTKAIVLRLPEEGLKPTTFQLTFSYAYSYKRGMYHCWNTTVNIILTADNSYPAAVQVGVEVSVEDGWRTGGLWHGLGEAGSSLAAVLQGPVPHRGERWVYRLLRDAHGHFPQAVYWGVALGKMLRGNIVTRYRNMQYLMIKRTSNK